MDAHDSSMTIKEDSPYNEYIYLNILVRFGSLICLHMVKGLTSHPSVYFPPHSCGILEWVELRLIAWCHIQQKKEVFRYPILCWKGNSPGVSAESLGMVLHIFVCTSIISCVIIHHLLSTCSPDVYYCSHFFSLK